MRPASRKPPPPPSLEAFRPGTLVGRSGFYRLGQTRSGQWWWLDPQNRPFWLRSVAAVNRSGWSDGRSSQPGAYSAAVERLYSEDPDSFVRSALQRLRGWGFNGLGAWAAAEFYERDFGYTELVEFRKVGPSFHSGRALLPDVFDPAWRDAADAWARQICAPRASSRDLMGYFTDHELGWAQPAPPDTDGIVPVDARAEEPSLLQICLSLEPGYRAYHAAWEFVLAPRQGSLARLAADWGLDGPHRETVRQLTQAERALVSPAYREDQRQFTREFARRYFSTCASLIRHYDPNHLILGCRFAQFPGAAVLKECAEPHVDVVSIRPGREAWERMVQACAGVNGRPVLLTGVTWSDPTFARMPLRREVRRLTSVERMLMKGRIHLEQLAGQRFAVGYEWSAWADAEDDEPPFGRGLVRVNDREAREHTELLADLNGRAERLRAKSR